MAGPGGSALRGPGQRYDRSGHHQTGRAQHSGYDQGLRGLQATGARRFSRLPGSQAAFAECEPIYQEFPGWKNDISGAKSVTDLPQEAIDFLNYIVRAGHGCRRRSISVGPRREQTIRVSHPITTGARHAKTCDGSETRRDLEWAEALDVLVVGGGGREHALVRGSSARRADRQAVLRSRQCGHRRATPSWS